MYILHGTWIPQAHDHFVQDGYFSVWVETTHAKSVLKDKNVHPAHLNEEVLNSFLKSHLGITDKQPVVKPFYMILPSCEGKPLPSPELSRYAEMATPETGLNWQGWEIHGYVLPNIFKSINELYFLAAYNATGVQIATDFWFWCHHVQALKQLILRDSYIPALKYRELPKKSTPAFEIQGGWEFASEQYETTIQQALDRMPLMCVAGHSVLPDPLAFYDKEGLLRHFSENFLKVVISATSLPETFTKKIKDSLIYNCIYPELTAKRQSPLTIVQYQLWQAWKQKIVGIQEAAAFYLCFKLQEASPNDPDNWRVDFLVASKQDPSLKMTLSDYWNLDEKTKQDTKKAFGADFERHFLINLGYAARIYPKIWDGMETDKPTGLRLNLDEAFTFFNESAWILEDAGYKIIIPAWWTPQGRRRVKVRLKTTHTKTVSKSGKGYFTLDTLVKYDYELSVDGQTITPQEWQQLVDAKIPLVQFRGQWMELDRDKMQEMLSFWKDQHAKESEISLLDLMKIAAEEGDDLEIEQDAALATMLRQLRDSSQLEPVDNPPQLRGTLREYQKRGVAWLQFLEKLGLHGCLADDMGLGKTLEVIARLINEKALTETVLPTLIIAPTSVIGSWQKEFSKFAPHFKVVVHHGSQRAQTESKFKELCSQYDVVVTSFTLARKDEKILNSCTWQRIVVDEAQNIKNPKTAQTKAILKLTAYHRLALTGTPVENRLLDLWSIFNFLNPGYLGKETQFRKSFEVPIQKDNDPVQAGILKRLVQPFILRRVKTDKNIIKDLPDKVEHKQYCNLTKEQASLYEAVVKDVSKEIETVDGIQRKGLILSTLLKLKQICNHPVQFLQDDSEFTPARSHKMERLTEMLEEVLAEGDSVLIFTQFTEIGEKLEKYLKYTLHYSIFYLHGGTPIAKREQMIEMFQNPETEPSIFVLSLKAGGVGVTLTKANHVFHFDRWWNPAVEDQATDRAFRIGQEKNVFVHKFVTLGTLEERIDEMIEDKKKMAGLIVGSDESWLTELDNERFKQLIALNRSAIIE